MVCAGDTVKGKNTEKQEVICKGDSGGQTGVSIYNKDNTYSASNINYNPNST